MTNVPNFYGRLAFNGSDTVQNRYGIHIGLFLRYVEVRYECLPAPHANGQNRTPLVTFGLKKHQTHPRQRRG